ncbi:MAG: sulfur transferase domain-containing protein [Isosphaeraceae bacterium]
MNVQRAVTPTITIGDQPTDADLEALKADGYAAVVNLRHPGEPDQPLSPDAEGEHVRSLGMDYLHQGVGGAPFTDDGVKAVCDFLDRHASDKVLVHCRKGGRAVALVLLQQAKTQGWPADEVLAKGDAMGLKVEGNLRLMVEQYLAQHTDD